MNTAAFAPATPQPPSRSWVVRNYQWVVLGLAFVIYIGCSLSPPSLMDDVDSVQATISRTMLRGGDWVTPHLDGIRYLEKPPLKYWLIAIAYSIFGISDFVARLPMALFTVLLCWLTARIAAWAHGPPAGLGAGVVMATSLGLFLFTRVQISDVALTFTIATAVWSFLRTQDPLESRPRLWGTLFGASVAVAILFKGLIGALFPFGTAFFYLVLNGTLFSREAWRRIAPLPALLALLAIAAPWHVLATIRNPPYWYVSMTSGPGHYHGFFWFYFFNEHILRFLNRRYPRDYNTVPRALFWLLHLAWFFPWSVQFPGLVRLGYRGADRAAVMNRTALLWIGLVLVFFSFSSTQEYYSMPCYPAIAILLGQVIVSKDTVIQKWRSAANWVLFGICAVALGAIAFLLVRTAGIPAVGDISNALVQHPEDYTLSLGHMGDLTVQSFAYLRTPLALAAIALLVGIVSLLLLKPARRFFGPAVMMTFFFFAAHRAMITFDPYLSSHSLAAALQANPKGGLIADDQYYTFASVFFYADQDPLLLNGRKNNLEYGSNAPDAPNVFIDDRDLARLWQTPARWYLLADQSGYERVSKELGTENIIVVKEAGGKYLLTNHPIISNA